MDMANYRNDNSVEFDFDELLEDPEIQAAMDDAEVRLSVTDSLRAGRKAAGLTQKDVANAMGTTQSAVSDLERGDTDPQLSTLQRYARATGGSLKVFVLMPDQASSASGSPYRSVSQEVAEPTHETARPSLHAVPSYNQIRVS